MLIILFKAFIIYCYYITFNYLFNLNIYKDKHLLILMKINKIINK